MRIASLLDLHLASGPRYYFDLEDDRIPAYLAKLSKPLRLEETLPDPFYRIQAARSATVTLSNVTPPGGDAAATLSQLLAGEEVLSIRAVLRLRDLDAGADIARLEGAVIAVSGLNQAEGTLEVEATDAEALGELLPRRSVLDLFPSAVVADADHSPIIPFGAMRKAELAQVHAHYLELTFTMVASGGNNARYEDLSSVENYNLAAGDVLYYDVLFLDPNAQIGIDLVATDGTRLRDLGAKDQNDLDASPATALPDELVLNRWYRRAVKLDALDGKTIDRFLVGCERDDSGVFDAHVANAVIINSAGTVARTLFSEISADPTYATAFDGNVGQNGFGAVRRAVYDYGPIRKPVAGALTVPNVYRDGRLVAAAEYTIVEIPGGFYVLRFALAQRSGQGAGAPMRMQADLVSTEFQNNPATVLAFLLSDATHGLGKTTAAASFAAAAAAYVAAG